MFCSIIALTVYVIIFFVYEMKVIPDRINFLYLFYFFMLKDVI